MADLTDQVLARYGLGAAIEPAPPVLFSASAERYRNAALDKLERARADLNLVASFLRNCPDRDDLFSAAGQNLHDNLRLAGEAAHHFFATRECQGEG